MNKRFCLKMILCMPALVMVVFLLNISVAHADPITVHPTNPRYFMNDSGDAIYMTGSHAWYNIHTGRGNEISTHESFEDYLDFMQSHGHNFVRLWTGYAYPDRGPYPWTRPGPGLAADNKPKFDMSTLNQSYFDLILERVTQVQNRDMYCSVMLFGSFNRFRETAGWKTVAWHPDNNINTELALAFDDNDGHSFFTADTDALEIQKILVRGFIDALNDMDNFMFEVMNEPNYTTECRVWNDEIISYMKSYESGKDKQHLIGATGGWSSSAINLYLMNCPCDWWSPEAGIYNGYDYRQGGPASYDSKPVISDTDHFDGGLYEVTEINKGVKLVWKTFTRGNNPILMDCHTSTWEGDEYGCFGEINPVFDPIRDAMGHTLGYANRFSDLASMVPSETISSTTYALHNPGVEYLVYQPNSGSFTVDMAAGSYDYEWFSANSGIVEETGVMSANGGSESFGPPAAISSDAVIYLHSYSPGVVAMPVISPDGGTFTDSVSVTLTCPTTGAEIRYTTDDSTPSSSSMLYTAPLVLNQNTTVKAKAFKSEMTDSDTSSAFFNIVPYVPSPIDCNGLVLLMHFDNQTEYGEGPSLVHDFSGNENEGTCSGQDCPTWTESGKFYGAFEFDGNDDFFSVSHDSSFANADGTIMAWFRLNDILNKYPIIHKDEADCYYDGCTHDYCDCGHFQLTYNSPGLGPDKLSVRLQNDGNGLHYKLLSDDDMLVMTQDTWYHTAVTFGASGMRLYINGNEHDYNQSTKGMQNNALPMYIGGAYGLSDFFNGFIDEVAVWNRSLSADEVREIYMMDMPVMCGPFNGADKDPQDGCIEEHELIPFIDLWMQDSTAYTMSEMMEAVTMYYSPGAWCS